MNTKLILTGVIAVAGIAYMTYTGQECNLQCILDFLFKVDSVVDEVVE